jgi:hypothetical protein
MSVAGKVAGVPGDDNVGPCKLVSPRGVDIVANNAPTAVDEIAGDRASHDTKSDDSDSLVHAWLFPAC